MRYKCQNEWQDFQQRTLNGIYATLETSDHALISLFENNAYQHYKEKKWTGMIRNKYRLRFELSPLSDKLFFILNQENGIAQKIFRINRQEIIHKIFTSNLRMKISFDNIVYLCNYLKIKNNDIMEITPQILKDDFKECFGEF